MFAVVHGLYVAYMVMWRPSAANLLVWLVRWMSKLRTVFSQLLVVLKKWLPVLNDAFLAV